MTRKRKTPEQAPLPPTPEQLTAEYQASLNKAGIVPITGAASSNHPASSFVPGVRDFFSTYLDPIPVAMAPAQPVSIAPPVVMPPQDAEALALGMLVKNPGWTVEQIADAIGVHRSTLYRKEQFMRAWGLNQGASRPDLPSGTKYADRPMEAWDERDDDSDDKEN